LIKEVRKSLADIKKAMKGLLIMPPSLETAAK